MRLYLDRYVSNLIRYSDEEVGERIQGVRRLCLHPRFETVFRTVYSMSASIKDMRMDHGPTDVQMLEEFLDRPNIIAVLKQMGGKRMMGGVVHAGLFIRTLTVPPSRSFA